ncbi:hypothetical protein NP233_g12542 [Leucocoprinus birnbaumii]|uniref:Ubiquitin-like domain-containing protein n=1 Tax=Leucocoprinus birnbaumii TaxID=56174 RepID=A0AAD5VEU6_9AGAR|nr:hypothetical protein NP233_g12542 [Leucocoprinus birnbaumii]
MRTVKEQNDIHFKVRPDTLFSVIKARYAQHVDEDKDGLRLIYNGRLIDDEDTPASLEMKYGDYVEVLRRLVGG